MKKFSTVLFITCFILIISVALIGFCLAIRDGAVAVSRYWRNGPLPPGYFIEKNAIGQYRYAYTNATDWSHGTYVAHEFTDHWTEQGAKDAAWHWHEYLLNDAKKGEWRPIDEKPQAEKTP